MTNPGMNGSNSTLDSRREDGSWLPREASEWWHLIALLLILVPLFATRGHWNNEGNPDTVAVGVAAWQLANNGTIDLSEFQVIADNQTELDRWYVFDRKGRIVSNRAPGLIALATPTYAVWSHRSYSNAPATVVALTTTTLAVVILWRLFTFIVSLRFATMSAAVLGLGTTTWVISASELWPHGPGQLWAAMVAASVFAGSYAATGIALGLSITTRPITAVFAAAIGLREAWRLRSMKPLLYVGALSTVGLAVVLFYNRWLFGVASVTGGYSSSFTTGAVERFALADYARNVLQMFFGATHGFLVVSSILGVATYGGVWAWKRIPGWARTLALSSLAYLLVHAFSNRASGGLAAYYRYPLEPIALASPFLVLGAHALWERGRVWRAVILLSSAVSVLLIAFEPAIVPAFEGWLLSRS
jgi:hypothetical protein